ncbi:MAG: ABC transporter ATP-binding protein [Microthrixaceae bacterium]|nr:ABC transporter ATP-binding protein [Microthrixaceae bacterium]MCB9387695.1 ABC transporter ATP-binding protein [Microthrixaceae bacterium]MCO5322682.1 ABC transporter ATP-binding protein [Microthrixaceae bacterium]
MSLLEVESLRCGYGIVEVLFGLSLSVDEGELVVVLGANGAGKTTTLRAVSGMISAEGSVRLNGREVLGRRPDQLLASGVAHVPQGRGTITALSVEDNLLVGAYQRKDSEVSADLEMWLEAFPRLGQRRNQQAGSMSGGEQQMLAIARAFMSRPKLLLLDEPSLGLAPLVTREVFDRLRDVTQRTGTAVLLVEQNANLALDFAARAYVLEAGSIVASGPAEELQHDEAIQKAYLGL